MGDTIWPIVGYGLLIGVPAFIGVILVINFVPPVKRWYESRKQK